MCIRDSTTLRDNIATVISRGSNKDVEDIDKRLEELQSELLKLTTSNADYEKVGEEIHRLRDQKQKPLLQNANRDEMCIRDRRRPLGKLYQKNVPYMYPVPKRIGHSSSLSTLLHCRLNLTSSKSDPIH